VKTLRSAPIALLGLVLALALVGSSCSSTNPVALQVGDWQLSNSDFQDQLNSFYEATKAAEGEASAAQLHGTTPGTWSTRYTAFMLNVQALSRVAQQAVADRGLEITDADLANARSSVESQFATSSGGSYFDTLPSSYTDAVVRGVAAQDVLGAALVSEASTDDALRVIYESTPAFQQEQACVSHILIVAGQPDGTTTPSDADYAAALAQIQQLQNGLSPATFANVAAASSDDTGSGSQGGDLGCSVKGGYVPEFDDAVWSQPIGEISSPVKTIYGYHLILVRSRGKLTFEEARSQLLAEVQNSGQSLLNREFAKVANEIGVTVDGRFGDFDETTGQITTPAGPSQPSTTLAVDPLADSSAQ
jgi:parvulin-like peptidyl-prolyl isomerase